MKTVGDRIRYYRNLKGWSQEDMADKLNLSLPAYSKIERDITDINISRLKQIAKVFGIAIVDLVENNNSATVSAFEKSIAEKEKLIIQLQQKIIELLEKK